MALEFYDGTKWKKLGTLENVEGTAKQIVVTPQVDNPDDLILSISPDPTLPGNTTINGTGYLTLPVGTTAERPETPVVGMLRFNNDPPPAKVAHGF